MSLELSQRVDSFIKLGERIKTAIYSDSKDNLSDKEKALLKAIDNAKNSNPWFTEENCRHALSGISFMLEKAKINKWLSEYNIPSRNEGPKTIAVVMAGNIPAVGFHDMLCVLVSGNKLLAKLSSNDKIIPQAITDLLIEIEPKWQNYISFSEHIIKDFDFIIATGSDNTARYFDYYFGKYPNIIRKNRNSIAVLSGNESIEELSAFGEDVFRYFGLGCRNVSHIIIPSVFELSRILDCWQNWDYVANHHKFFNNYEYNKSIFLINKEKHLDNGFLLLRESSSIHSPVSVVHYSRYANIENVRQYLNTEKDKIQCISSTLKIGVQGIQVVKPGYTQKPELWDYADGIDTLAMLIK